MARPSPRPPGDAMSAKRVGRLAFIVAFVALALLARLGGADIGPVELGLLAVAAGLAAIVAAVATAGARLARRLAARGPRP
jgi:hypothetical protein